MRLPQRRDELRNLIKLLRREGVTSFLEVGSRYGDTFFEIVTALPDGARAVAVDLPGGIWGREDSEPALRDCVEALKGRGYKAAMVLGNSTSAATINHVTHLGPFDAVLIDGDHRMEGLVQDWINYGQRSRIVAFHDIDGWMHFEGRTRDPVDVPFVWMALKRKHRHIEFIGKKRGMGIGVIFNEP